MLPSRFTGLDKGKYFDPLEEGPIASLYPWQYRSSSLTKVFFYKVDQSCLYDAGLSRLITGLKQSIGPLQGKLMVAMPFREPWIWRVPCVENPLERLKIVSCAAAALK